MFRVRNCISGGISTSCPTLMALHIIQGAAQVYSSEYWEEVKNTFSPLPYYCHLHSSFLLDQTRSVTVSAMETGMKFQHWCRLWDGNQVCDWVIGMWCVRSVVHLWVLQAKSEKKSNKLFKQCKLAAPHKAGRYIWLLVEVALKFILGVGEFPQTLLYHTHKLHHALTNRSPAER